MKVLKKFASIIIAVCLMIPVLSTVVFAADGVLMFSDPSTKVGENVSVDFVVQSSGGTIGSARKRTFRKGDLLVLFSDTLFAPLCVSPSFTWNIKI